MVNYDLPDDKVTYVHRIGRTGRIKNGFATSFFDVNSDNNRKLAKDLVKVIFFKNFKNAYCKTIL